MANLPLPGPRSPLDSFDDSTGPATPYAPSGGSLPALFADVQPKSGFRAKKKLSAKLIAVVAVAYVLGAISASLVFLLLK